MNKIILLGRLTKDVEILRSSKETMIGKFILAVPRKFSKEGEDKKTDFINIVTFGKLTEFACKFFKKGQQVLVSGRLEINLYKDENGDNRYATQVIAEELNFADSKRENTENDNLIEDDYPF